MRNTTEPSTIPLTAKDAVTWFLNDMAEVSGFGISGFKRTAEMTSMYPVYRPMLTSPDPWYYAGTVALEASKVADLFPQIESDAVLREIVSQVDGVVGRKNKDVSTLTFVLLGRLGLGAVLMRRKVPDEMLGKIMMILIGSETDAAPRMPSPETYEQLRKALRFGPPVWWNEFRKQYHIELVERPIRRVIPARDRASVDAGLI